MNKTYQQRNPIPTIYFLPSQKEQTKKVARSKMNLKMFKKRLIKFYSSWQDNKKDLWGNSDVLVMCTPPSSDKSPHPISSSFFFWLLGHDISDTIAVFTKEDIYFFCTKKRFTMLQNLEDAANLAVNVRVRVTEKKKKETGLEKLDDILRAIKGTETSWDYDIEETPPLVIGYIPDECPKSVLLWCCINNLKRKEFLGISVSGFSQLLDHGKGPSAKDIQMLNIPHEVEQMLLMAPETKMGKSNEVHEKAPSLDKGGADLSSTAVKLDIVEKAAYGNGKAGISTGHILGAEEEDEWVFI